VQEKLVACVNIITNSTSIYNWQDRIEESEEIILLAKTRDNIKEIVMQRIKELHQYDCPCIIAFPITAGDNDYLKWIENSISINNKVE
jgi:periplasmic divalent cation tolerance protein